MKEKILAVLKKIWPHIAILLLFVALSALYFSPVLKGNELPQSDQTHSIGAAQELVQYEKQTGKLPQWTNSMFGGMPAYQIRADSSSNYFRDFNSWLRFGLPYTTIAILFMYLVGFYVLMLSLKINRWLAVLGSIAFAFGSYNIIIIAAGHITKAYAIALAPAVLGGVMMIFRGKRLAGGVLTTVALGMQLAYNHVQITYYLALTIAILVIVKFIYALKDKLLADWGKNLATLVCASVLACLPGLTNLWTTYEYGQYSIRGASELSTQKGERQSSGLDKDYALSWSYGIHETPTLLIPNAVGGESKTLADEPRALTKVDPSVVQQVAQSVSAYWGGRPFTSGPVYVGAIVCFLFFLGCFYYNGREKWWLIAATIFSIFLAWGKNFPLLTDFMFYHFPFYSKFRTVEMALVIATITMPLLGMLGLKEIFENPERIKYEPKKFLASILLTGGVALLLAITPTTFYSFLSDAEAMQFAQLKAQDTSGIYAIFEQSIIDVRASLTSSDAWRSLMLILLASSALWFRSVCRINARTAMLALILLVFFDLWFVDKRYLNDDKFVSHQTAQNDFKLSEADKIILADKEPHRVMSVYTNPFNEVRTSYYHQSVGGYHGAKLRRYQDVIDRYLSGEWQRIVGAIRAQDYEGIDAALVNSTALNILNTKYLIYNPASAPLVNRYAQGAAWFVGEVRSVSTPDEALASLGTEDLRSVAIVEGEGVACQLDSAAQIVRTSYAPDRLTYHYESAVDAFAVFSEIYYPAGWKAFVDGEETDILQTDYILRGMQLPAGEHDVEFRFEPRSFAIGSTVATCASIVVVLLIIAVIVFEVRKKPSENEENN